MLLKDDHNWLGLTYVDVDGDCRAGGWPFERPLVDGWFIQSLFLLLILANIKLSIQCNTQSHSIEFRENIFKEFSKIPLKLLKLQNITKPTRHNGCWREEEQRLSDVQCSFYYGVLRIVCAYLCMCGHMWILKPAEPVCSIKERQFEFLLLNECMYVRRCWVFIFFLFKNKFHFIFHMSSDNVLRTFFRVCYIRILPYSSESINFYSELSRHMVNSRFNSNTNVFEFDTFFIPILSFLQL